ncbi:hypothetical protein [Nocardiopsis ansamitocini]|uniref:Uncharacterized protein n=1 Tax=Nocardiopsis ansamitocini TaxID=1670832 RepID=A0A9W6P6F5_9ACTN|nr:hypothetical protein [Nocardiopsis ansamitocini]GLU47937.1 hypothetical protein Nans01_22880 [Nocardiopsis ansamitocini]
MSQVSESKAGPLSKDVMAIVLYNVIAIVSLVLFAAMGLGIFQAAVGF